MVGIGVMLCGLFNGQEACKSRLKSIPGGYGMKDVSKKDWGEADIPSQSGKVILVTGANIGLGYEASRMLAAKSAHVLMACRSRGRAEAARSKIKEISPFARVDIVDLDLADLESVAQVPAQLAELGVSQIDVLINNAGIMRPPRRNLTKQGFESQFGTNHLGHFALTRTLMPLLAPTARIVNVSSLADRYSDVNWDDLQWEVKYSPSTAYGQSKTANLLFTKMLNERLTECGSQIMALAAHPGISDTNLVEASDLKKFAWLIRGMSRLGIGPYPKIQTPAMGALPQVYAATGDVEPGAYYGPANRGYGHPSRAEQYRAPHSESPDSAKRLWALSEELTGAKFDLAG